MKTLTFRPRSPEWHANRATCFNASDAPAMLGCSPHESRSQLLARLHSGIDKEFSDYQQERVVDPGHRFEDLALPLAEQFIGETLYPVGGSEDFGLSRPLGASFDGITLTEEIDWEHKRLNNSLRKALPNTGPDGAALNNAADLPKMYRVQMEQQLMVCQRATRALFMASEWATDGTLVDARYCWYIGDPALRAEIIAGWQQLDADLASYVPPAAAAVVVASPVQALPAVAVIVEGAITVRDNFAAFEVALLDFLEHRLIREPNTDQDFADLDLQIKAMKGAEAALESAESQMLAQIQTVDQAKKTKDMLAKLVRDNRLMAEKLYASEKERRRTEEVMRGRKALAEFVASLDATLGKAYMPPSVAQADFGLAIKGLRSLDSVRAAIDQRLANAKIEANAVQQRILTNLRALDAAAENAFLFPDTATLVLKAPEDLAAQINSRIAAHKAKEAARLEAERERIRAEEQVKAQREAAEAQRVDAARVAAEQQKMVDESRQRFLEGERNKSAPFVLPTGAPESVATPPAATLPIRRVPATQAAVEPATLNLTAIAQRLGFSLPATFISESLGIQPAKTDKAAKLYRESQWPLICDALKAHIDAVSELQAA